MENQKELPNSELKSENTETKVPEAKNNRKVLFIVIAILTVFVVGIIGLSIAALVILKTWPSRETKTPDVVVDEDNEDDNTDNDSDDDSTEKVVFLISTDEDPGEGSKATYQLYSVNLDGSNLKKLTKLNPGTDGAAYIDYDVNPQEGRIILRGYKKFGDYYVVNSKGVQSTFKNQALLLGSEFSYTADKRYVIYQKTDGDGGLLDSTKFNVLDRETNKNYEITKQDDATAVYVLEDGYVVAGYGDGYTSAEWMFSYDLVTKKATKLHTVSSDYTKGVSESFLNRSYSIGYLNTVEETDDFYHKAPSSIYIKNLASGKKSTIFSSNEYSIENMSFAADYTKFFSITSENKILIGTVTKDPFLVSVVEYAVPFRLSTFDHNWSADGKYIVLSKYRDYSDTSKTFQSTLLVLDTTTGTTTTVFDKSLKTNINYIGDLGFILVKE